MNDSGFNVNSRIFRVLWVPDNGNAVYVGTAFTFRRSDLALTAMHVIRNLKGQLYLADYLNTQTVYPVQDIQPHPNGDVAALCIAGDTSNLLHFDLGEPLPGFKDGALGEDVGAFGFPVVSNRDHTVAPGQPGVRLMKGHIQRPFDYTTPNGIYRYVAFELSFLSFPGLSGAPVFRETQKNEAIAVVTEDFSITRTAVLDDGQTTRFSELKPAFLDKQPVKYRDTLWTIGLSLLSIREWLEAL